MKSADPAGNRRTGEPLRVLMLTHYFDDRRGGIELVAAALCREFVKRDLEVLWLAARSANGGCKPGAGRRIALAASGLAERWLKIPYPLLLPSAWRTIFREAARHDVVMVHDALYMTSIIGCRAARAHRKPVVVVQHVGFVPYRNALLRSLLVLANRWIAAPLLRHADQAVFISQLTMRYFADARLRHTPALIFNGVDTGVFRPARGAQEVQEARRHLGLPLDSPLALFVGRFVEKKGLHVLERIARRHDEVVFVFAGHGELDPRQWRLPNVRVFAGLSGDTLAPLYRASDLLLLPSVGEGFPLVVQEALACGLSVLCGADTASADPRAAGLLHGIPVDLSDPERTAHRFAEQMARMLAHTGEPTDRRAAYEFARANYSWEASADRYAGILEAVCTKRAPAAQ